MNPFKTDEEMVQLTKRHVEMSENALAQLPHDELPRLIVWPESPMNFSYANDLKFQDFISRFARNNNAALILNSQEPAPNNGIYNSALLINPQGRLIGQYDKIRLLPFGEYVPLPRWLPGANLISGLVGDFWPDPITRCCRLEVPRLESSFVLSRLIHRSRARSREKALTCS